MPHSTIGYDGETLPEVSKAHRKSVALSLDEYLTHQGAALN